MGRRIHSICDEHKESKIAAPQNGRRSGPFYSNAFDLISIRWRKDIQ